jgi:predicted restriction endonuclease
LIERLGMTAFGSVAHDTPSSAQQQHFSKYLVNSEARFQIVSSDPQFRSQVLPPYYRCLLVL